MRQQLAEMLAASKEEQAEFYEFCRESWSACVVNGGQHWLSWLYWILPVWWGYSGKTPWYL